MKKMKENREGQYIPAEYAYEIIETLESNSEFDDEFVKGAAFALSYLTCPAGEGMHGATIEEFAENAVKVMTRLRSVPPEVIELTEKIVGDLKADGFNVKDARIIGVIR